MPPTEALWLLKSVTSISDAMYMSTRMPIRAQRTMESPQKWPGILGWRRY